MVLVLDMILCYCYWIWYDIQYGIGYAIQYHKQEFYVAFKFKLIEMK